MDKKDDTLDQLVEGLNGRIIGGHGNYKEISKKLERGRINCKLPKEPKMDKKGGY